MISKRFENGLKKFGVTMDDLKNFKYCGGDKGTHLNYYKICFPHEDLPDEEEKCICGHRISENCYITNGNVCLTIGNCCIKKFISPDQQKRTCKKCGKVHRNRKDNYCRVCRQRMSYRVGKYILTFD